jgi:hypothetical protein
VRAGHGAAGETELGDSVLIDLTLAEPSTYRGLRTADWVLIDGTPVLNRRHVIAREIWHYDRGGWTQAPRPMDGGEAERSEHDRAE